MEGLLLLRPTPSSFKIHKPHNHIPPVRPIVSGSGSMLENTSRFEDFHLNEFADKHKSYIQDTPDFITQLEQFNDKVKLPERHFL